MDLKALIGSEIQVIIGNAAVKGKLKEAQADQIILESRNNEVYINTDKINYVVLDKDEKVKIQ